MTSEQLEYVKGELAKGLAVDAIKQTLRDNGYSEQLIVEIFNAVAPGAVPVNAVP